MNSFVPRPSLTGLSPSFGFGDRTGLATPGHVAAMKSSGQGIVPIFPQQSIREITRLQRPAPQVMQEAIAGVVQAGWEQPFGADADHLKTTADIDQMADAGFTFFTFDPSPHVDQHADDYSDAQLAEKFAEVRELCPWVAEYQGRALQLTSGTRIEFTLAVCQRAAVKYGRAIAETIRLAQHLDQQQRAAGREYEIELSVDETEQPTTLAEHVIIAEQCLKQGVKIVSLAPRFLGEFEKGIDYKGDLSQLETSLIDHADIARKLGPYKLSLHSGSDKLSIYPLFARVTGGLWHVKTSGTSFLEGLRVVARHEPDLFRDILRLARSRYDQDKASYHVSCTLADVPEPTAALSAAELEHAYLDTWETVPAGQGFTAPGRQIPHCAFGSIFLDPTLGPQFKAVLQTHQATYTELLEAHFARHLQALQTA